MELVTVFGDSEPEDSWHPDDAIPILIDNLLRRLDLLDGSDDLRTRLDLLTEISGRVDFWQTRRSSLSSRELVRLDQITADLEHVRARCGL